MPFVITLLRHGLGVSENQTRIGTGEEAWTLGAALAEGSKVGAGRGPKQRLLSRATTVSLCSGTFLLWTLFLAWTWWCTVRPTSSSMSPRFPWALHSLRGAQSMSNHVICSAQRTLQGCMHATTSDRMTLLERQATMSRLHSFTSWSPSQCYAPAFHLQDFGESHMERKISGSVPDQGLPGQLYHTGGMLSMPLLPQMKPGEFQVSQIISSQEAYSPQSGGLDSMMMMIHFVAGSTLQGDQSVGGATAASPTAVIGGNFNSNIARLSQQTNQRKRVSSLENLQTLR